MNFGNERQAMKKKKVLVIEWEAFGMEDLKEAFCAEGYEVVGFPFSKYENAIDNLKVEKSFRSVLHGQTPDGVFSFDYYPIFSRICQLEGIPYIAWIYDNPQIMLYSDTITNPCNHIYIFDKRTFQKFYSSGIRTVHYMPLAVNTERLDRMDSAVLSYAYDVSFVGALYIEEQSYYEQVNACLSDYAKGYLDAVMVSQMKIQGYNFIEEILDPVIEEFHKALPIDFGRENRATREYFYANYVINRKITSLERITLLSAVAGKHGVDLFTLVKEFRLPNVRNHGAVDPYTDAPLVYKQSRINLNITLRSIESGIPLRAFEIMGAGGFLLSNYQADFLDYFVPDEDFVYYEDQKDLMRKIDYYLYHEKERQAIAKNGHDKMASGHTYRHRIREIFAEAGC